MSTHTPAVNKLPASVLLLCLLIILFEMYVVGSQAGLWGNLGTRIFIIQQFSIDPKTVKLGIKLGIYSWEWMLTFITYPFISLNILQSIFGAVFILALGKFVGETLGNAAVFIIFFTSTIIGALGYVYLTQDTYPLLGAYPATYGLIGAFTYVRFALANGIKLEQIRAFQLICAMMFINITVSIITGGPLTWVAELVGAVVGFLCAAALRPGAIPHLLQYLRRD